MNETASTTTLLGMFYHWERSKPDATYLRQPNGQKWKDYSWSEVGDQARRVAAALQALGLANGDRVSILSKNCAHWVIADLAIMMAGASSAPIFTTMTSGDARYCLDRSSAKVLFVGETDNWEAVRAELPDGLVVVSFPSAAVPGANYSWDELLGDQAPLPGEPDRAPTDEITTIFTSGSTGKPKGVVYDFEGASHIARNLGQTFRMNSNDRLISYLPLAHGFERAAVDFMSLYAGCTIGFNEEQATFGTDMVEVRPTFFQCVPRLWSKFQGGILAMTGGQEALDTLLTNPETGASTKMKIRASLGLDEARILLTGSAPTPPSLHEWYENLNMPLCEIYGQSEILSGTSNLPWDRKPGTLGKPTMNTDIKIADDGEILIRAQAVMQGYLDEPEKTAETLVDGWIHTGDRGALDQDGFLSITGRVKEIFKTAKGKYVAPLPIEGELSLEPFIEQLCVMGAGLPQTAMAIQLSAEGKAADPQFVDEQLRQAIIRTNAKLDSHAKLAAVVISAEDWSAKNGLVTHTLKIKRAAVEKRYADLAERAMSQGGTTANPVLLREA
jgi:long-chain acyl-CoA synthetase